MNTIGIALVWCALQVTLIALVAAALDFLIRRVRPMPGGGAVLTGLLLIVLLTAAALSPWPRWRLPHVAGPPPAPSEAHAVGRATGKPSPPEGDARPSATSFAWDAMVEGLSRPAVASPRPGWRWPAVVGLSLLALMGLGVGWLTLGLIAVRRQRFRSRPLVDESLSKMVAGLREQLACRRPIEIRQSGNLSAAATIGWRRPTVLLPPGWTAWTADELRAVLAHEIAHARSQDFLALVCGQLGLGLHWYHPLVHWLVRRLRLEQELAADMAAAGVFPSRQDYLKAIAHLALCGRRQPLSWPARSFLPARSNLMTRIAMLRDSSLPERRLFRNVRVLSVVLLLVCGLLVAGLRSPGAAMSPVMAADVAPAKPVAARAPAKPRVPVLRREAGRPVSPELLARIIAANRAWLEPTGPDFTYTYTMGEFGTKRFWQVSVAFHGEDVTVHVAGKKPQTVHERPRHLVKAVCCFTPLSDLIALPEARTLELLAEERLGSSECWVISLRSGGQLSPAAARRWKDSLREASKRPEYEYQFVPIGRVKEFDGHDGAAISVKSLHAQGPGWPSIVEAQRINPSQIRWGGKILTAEWRQRGGVRQPTLVLGTDATFQGESPITKTRYHNGGSKVVLGEGKEVVDEELLAKRLNETRVPPLSTTIQGGLWDRWSGGFYPVDQDQVWVDKETGLVLREEQFSGERLAALVEYVDFVPLAGGARVPRRIEFALEEAAFQASDLCPWVFRMDFKVHEGRLWLLDKLTVSSKLGTQIAIVSAVKLDSSSPLLIPEQPRDSSRPWW